MQQGNDINRLPPTALFLVKSLADFFSEQEVLARALGGEKVGAWAEEES
jgi:hypothetical protein